MGTLSGAMATYFFTREQVLRQESQTKMYQTAFQESGKEKTKARKQSLKAVAEIKPGIESPQNQQAIEKLLYVVRNCAFTFA
jgi:hypothetical protein